GRVFFCPRTEGKTGKTLEIWETGETPETRDPSPPPTPNPANRRKLRQRSESSGHSCDLVSIRGSRRLGILGSGFSAGRSGRSGRIRRLLPPRDRRNPRFKFAAFGTAFSRHASGMVRGERPRLHRIPPESKRRQKLGSPRAAFLISTFSPDRPLPDPDKKRRLSVLSAWSSVTSVSNALVRNPPSWVAEATSCVIPNRSKVGNPARLFPPS
ncbi:MAG: hypothetical protein RLZZ221_1546, partial [Verrucomicrobiota bacterium]